MSRFIRIAALLVLSAMHIIYAQDTLKYELEELTVTAGRLPVLASESARSVIALTSERIAAMAVSSVPDLLQYVAGVDLQQRGIDGIQADINIRGGGFEQTLVMIDGVIVNDPQTGHHTMNLPVTIDDIERIEILKGQGSKSFGPNAFSGAINIITKSISDNRAKVNVEGGEYGYYGGRISGNYNAAGFFNRVSYERKKSDGYIHNTNYESEIFSYGNSYSFGKFVIKGLFGYNDKKFGANSFYTSRFPNQWERTTTRFANAKIIYSSGQISNEVKIFYRGNNDDFMLNYENPSFYRNNHKTNTFGTEVQITISSSIGMTAIGGEFISDKIASNNLGNHSRSSKGIFLEHLFTPVKNLSVSLGGFIYNYDLIGWKIWPGFDFSYLLNEKFKLFGSVGKAFRIPTYTELFYNDPATIGNAALQSEETLNSEIGVSYFGSKIDLSVSLFGNNGRNIIDWIRYDPKEKWRVRNISNLNTSGLELSVTLKPNALSGIVDALGVQYTYLASNRKKEPFESRYALKYLRRQAVLNVTHPTMLGIKFNWAFRYEDRENYSDVFISDLKLIKAFSEYRFFVSAFNLFDVDYFDVSGVALPGRWLRAGFSYSIL
jgi:iron complex outermembrane receptor protein